MSHAIRGRGINAISGGSAGLIGEYPLFCCAVRLSRRGRQAVRLLSVAQACGHATYYLGTRRLVLD